MRTYRSVVASLPSLPVPEYSLAPQPVRLIAGALGRSLPSRSRRRGGGVMQRRRFVRDAAILGVAAGLAPRAVRAADEEVTARRIPRWRGFNLQGRFGMP